MVPFSRHCDRESNNKILGTGKTEAEGRDQDQKQQRMLKTLFKREEQEEEEAREEGPAGESGNSGDGENVSPSLLFLRQ